MKPCSTLIEFTHIVPFKKSFVDLIVFASLSMLPFIASAGESVRATQPHLSKEHSQKNYSPFTGTESLRTNLYLLNTANNTTILADGVLTEYNDLYHDNVTLEDAYKFTNINENLGMNRYGSTLAVERRPIIISADTVFFRLWKTTQRYYQFEFIATNLYHPGMQAVLQDTYLGTNTPLLLTSTTKVTFSVNSNAASANVNRFKVIYQTSFAPSPLPVTFTSVRGYELKNKISIDWKVENELNILGYEIEHSANGKEFKKLAAVSVNGSFNASNNYSYSDEFPSTGNNFYRIRSLDRNGGEKYSPVAKVVIGKGGTGNVSIYPNPVKGNLINIQFTNQPKGAYSIRLINSNGQPVALSKLVINSSNISQTLFANQQLSPGIYQVEIRKPDNSIEIQKAIVQ